MKGVRGHVALLCVLVASPLVALLVSGAVYDHAGALNAARMRTVELARLGAQRQGVMVDEVAGTLRLLGQIPWVHDAVPGICETQLRAAVRDDPQIISATVVNRDGTIACSSLGRLRSSISVSDRTYFRQALDAPPNAPPATEIVVGRATGKPIITVALEIPPTDPDWKPRGVIFAAANLQWLAELAAQIPDQFGHLALVIDPLSGEVLARAPGRAIRPYDGQMADPALLTALRRLPVGGSISQVRGTALPVIFGFAPIVVDSRHLMLAVGLSRKDVLRAVNDRLWTGAKLALLAILATVLISWLSATTFVLRPIIALATAARRFGAGDLDARAPTNVRFPELSRLSSAFNRMASDLQMRNQERAELHGKLEAANRQLGELALQDPLTGLANRRRFEEVLQSEHRRAKRSVTPLSLIAIDVDHFKAYNDTYGHPAGDACLKALTRAIEDTIRRPGDLAARIGGEEFSVLLPVTDAIGATFLATSIHDAVLELALPHIKNPMGIVTISIGVATVLPLDESSLVMLVKAADDALYTAKRSGRNAIRVAPSFAPNDIA